MRRASGLLLSFVVVCSAAAAIAQAQPAAQGRGGQNRAPLTPEQQEAQKARQAASAPDAPRPIDMLDTVWIEEQTWMETREPADLTPSSEERWGGADCRGHSTRRVPAISVTRASFGRGTNGVAGA